MAGTLIDVVMQDLSFLEDSIIESGKNVRNASLERESPSRPIASSWRNWLTSMIPWSLN